LASSRRNYIVIMSLD